MPAAAQTDDMVWSYVVRGAPPEYKTPQVATKIDNKMDPAIVSRMTAHAAESRARNHLRENMTVAKAATKVPSAGSVGPPAARSVSSLRK